MKSTLTIKKKEKEKRKNEKHTFGTPLHREHKICIEQERRKKNKGKETEEMEEMMAM